MKAHGQGAPEFWLPRIKTLVPCFFLGFKITFAYLLSNCIDVSEYSIWFFFAFVAISKNTIANNSRKMVGTMVLVPGNQNHGAWAPILCYPFKLKRFYHDKPGINECAVPKNLPKIGGAP